MEYKSIEELNLEAKKYENVSAATLVKVFTSNHIYMPDFVERFLLVNFLKKYVFEIDKMQTYSDEFVYRLRSYDQFFSIYLMIATAKEQNYACNTAEFKNLFMRFFLKNEKKFKTSIAFEKSLAQLSGKKDGKNESFDVVVDAFKELFYTPKGYLDGLPLSIIKESINETYTLGQIKEFGAIYGVNVPRRINKEQLISLLASRFRLTADEVSALEPKSVLELTQYAKEKGFRISTDLKKNDMVEYIVFSLGKYNEDVEKDLYNYDILAPEEEVDEQLEKSLVQESDQSIPTTNAYIDNKDEVVEEVEPQEEVKPVEEAKPVEEVKPVEEAKPVEEVKPVEEAKPVEEKKPVEEAKPIEPVETPQEYYDSSVDDEIRHIIKNYYSKKARKDRGMRWLIVILFILVLAGLAYFALRYFKVF